MNKLKIIIFLLFISTSLFFSGETGNKILLLYQTSDGQTPEENNAALYLVSTLNNWGFDLEFVDVDGKLPNPNSLNNVYAVIGWLSSGARVNPLELVNWYERIMNNNIRLVLMGSIGCWQDKETKKYILESDVNKIFLNLGVEYKGGWTNQKDKLEVIFTDNEIYPENFEVTDETNYFLFHPTNTDINKHLTIERNDINNSESVLVFSSPKGGFIFYDYILRGGNFIINLNNFLIKSLFTTDKKQKILIVSNNSKNIEKIEKVFRHIDTQKIDMNNFLNFKVERMKMYNLIILEGIDCTNFSNDFISKINEYVSAGRGLVVVDGKWNENIYELIGVKKLVSSSVDVMKKINFNNEIFLDSNKLKFTLNPRERTLPLYELNENTQILMNVKEKNNRAKEIPVVWEKKSNNGRVIVWSTNSNLSNNLNIFFLKTYSIILLQTYSWLHKEEIKIEQIEKKEYLTYFSSKTIFKSDGEIEKDDINKKVYNQLLVVIKEELKLHFSLNKYIFLDLLIDIQNRAKKCDIAKDKDNTSDLTNVATRYPATLRYNDLTFKSRLGVEIPNNGPILSSTLGFDFFNAFQVQNNEIVYTPGHSLSEKVFSGEDDYLDQLVFYPYFDFMIEWNKIDYFTFNLKYTFQLEKNSVIPWIDGFYFSKNTYLEAKSSYQYFHTFLVQHDILLNINYNFGFAKVYPLTNITFGNSFNFKFFTLSDFSQMFSVNSFPFIYSMNQSIDYLVFKINRIGFFFHLLFKLDYEGSQKDFEEVANVSVIDDEIKIDEDSLFVILYSPHQNLSIKGGNKIMFNFKNTTSVPLAMSLTYYAGALWRDVFTKPIILEEDNRDYNIVYFLFIINYGIELQLKKFYLTFQFEYSLAYDIDLEDETWQSFYCSLFIRVPIYNK